MGETDLIDRQAAIDELNGKDPSQIWDTADIEVWLNTLPSASPERCADCENLSKTQLLIPQPEQKWIPCSERLPEDYEDVLVWFEYFRYGNYNCLYQMHGIGSYSSRYNSWLINQETGWNELKVFAWMPLPKPPKEGDE